MRSATKRLGVRTHLFPDLSGLVEVAVLGSGVGVLLAVARDPTLTQEKIASQAHCIDVAAFLSHCCFRVKAEIM